MYLKRLEMKGFKSFADKTVIDFENGVTCVVGPNGSGKSNITDAIRWVLGEQKIKTLRGSKMEDVIFNGTRSRKALGFAEVSLFFDNGDAHFPLDYNEVVVSRKLYRSGESEYSINGTATRLKEVKELFMDTGIGLDGYSIVGQGRIERILSSNKEERRLIFEEVSGIAKYKSRKREAERKLLNTDQNLSRVEDIVSELSIRVEPLKIESEKAQTYKQLTEELKDIEINQYISDYERVQKKIDDEKQKMDLLILNNKQLDKNIIQLKDEQKQESQKLEAVKAGLDNLKDEYFEKLNKINILNGKKNLIEEKKNNIEQNRQKINMDVENINREMGLNRQKINLFETEKQDILSKKQNLEQQKFDIEAQYESIVNNFDDKEKFIEDSKYKIIEILNTIEKLNLHINNSNHNISSLKSREEELDEELQKNHFKYDKLVHLKQNKEEQIDDIQNKQQDLDERINIVDELVKKYQTEISETEDKIRKIESELTKADSEMQILSELADNYDGFDRSVQKVLKQCKSDVKLGRGIIGVVAELISVDKKYEKAIDISLGRKMQNIVCEDSSDAKRIIEYLKREKIGRVTFLPLSNVQSRGDDTNSLSKIQKCKGYLGKASELISFDEKYQNVFENLLGRMVVVDNFDNGMEVLKIPNIKYKVVTLDGEVLIQGGSITGGSFKSNISNIFARKRQIDDLKNSIEGFKINYDESSNLFESKKRLLDDSLNQQSELNIKFSENRIKLVELSESLKSLDDEINSFELDIKKNTDEKQNLKNQIEQILESITETEQRIKHQNEEHLKLTQEISKNSEFIKSVSDDIELFKNQITKIKIEFATLEEKHSNLEKDIFRINAEQNSNLEKESNYIKILEDMEKDFEVLTADLENIVIEIEKETKFNESYEQKKTLLESQRQEIESIINDKVKQIDNVLLNLDDIKDKIHKLDIVFAKRELERENIISEIWEKYEISIIEALKFKKEHHKDAVKQIKDIKKRLKEIGDVNLGAIEEYENVKERYEFLSSQRSDLLDAQRSLRKVIKDLENVMELEFRQNFKRVRNNFIEIFSELFGGGKSDLVLDDDENVLESDIGILAQPSGKKLQDLSLLSGGEKALTAIALLFAILKTKPSPFCILDEIEAALDDINVTRFAEFLEHFTRKSQFVIITHRKGTMEIADVLYGVTMQEYGVSKVVSMKLENM